MSAKTRVSFFLLLLAALAAGIGCATHTKPGPASPEALSPKLNPLVYFEDGQVVFVGVDGRAAQYVKEGSLFPVGIGLANRSMGSLTFSRESFVLEDAEGRKYPLASFEEFQAYDRSRTDANLLDVFAETMRARFGNFSVTEFDFFPSKGSRAPARDRIELGRTTWTIGYLYFPIPPGGIHGEKFSLLVKPKEVPDAFFVKFSIL